METSEKVPFLSNLFKNLISEKITFEEFNRLSFIINSLTYTDIEVFINNASNTFDETPASILYSKGLIIFKSAILNDAINEVEKFYVGREYALSFFRRNFEEKYNLIKNLS